LVGFAGGQVRRSTAAGGGGGAGGAASAGGDDGGDGPVAKKPRFEEQHMQRAKEQLAARLEAPRQDNMINVDKIKSEPLT